MKHSVEHVCGHPAEHDLTGSLPYQAWEAKRRGGGPCPICWATSVDSENALNAAYAAEQDLPELAGTEKQVAWAVTIRADFLAGLPGKLAALNVEVTRQHGAALASSSTAVLALLRELACTELSAPWWIRNRTRLADSIIKRHSVKLKSGGAGETARRLLFWVGPR